MVEDNLRHYTCIGVYMRALHQQHYGGQGEASHMQGSCVYNGHVLVGAPTSEGTGRD